MAEVAGSYRSALLQGVYIRSTAFPFGVLQVKKKGKSDWKKNNGVGESEGVGFLLCFVCFFCKWGGRGAGESECQELHKRGKKIHGTPPEVANLHSLAF